MEKLYEKLDNLKKILDETNTVKEIKYLSEKIINNKKLVELIAKYNLTQDEKIKKDILNNEDFQKYKHQEAELNFIILEINRELKKITKKDKCGL